MKKKKIIDQSPPTVLNLDGVETSEKTTWKAALEQLSARIFKADKMHQEEFDDFVEELRGEALVRSLEGMPRGIPPVSVFLDMLTRMTDFSKPGPDGVPGLVWKNVSHATKLELYKHFVERFQDTFWSLQEIHTWESFELLGIPKTSIGTSCGQICDVIDH